MCFSIKRNLFNTFVFLIIFFKWGFLGLFCFHAGVWLLAVLTGTKRLTSSEPTSNFPSSLSSSQASLLGCTGRNSGRRLTRTRTGWAHHFPSYSAATIKIKMMAGNFARSLFSRCRGTFHCRLIKVLLKGLSLSLFRT